MNESIFTWNLFLTAVLVPLCCLILGKWIDIKAKRREEGWIQYYALKDKTTEEEKKTTRDNLACMRTHLSQLEKNKASKVSVAESELALWKRLHGHDHLIDCDGADCTAKRTNGVIIGRDLDV